MWLDAQEFKTLDHAETRFPNTPHGLPMAIISVHTVSGLAFSRFESWS